MAGKRRGRSGEIEFCIFNFMDMLQLVTIDGLMCRSDRALQIWMKIIDY